MQQRYLKHLIFAGHCIASALFVLSPWFFEPHRHPNEIETMLPMTPVFMLTNLVAVVFFYVNGWLLVPRFLLQYEYKTYILTLIGCVLLVVLSTSLFGWALGIKPPPPPDFKNITPREHRLRPPLKSNAFLLLLGVWGLSTTMAFVNKWRTLEQEEAERTANQTAQELSALRAQINPHFLFNTLNNIYSLTQINPDAAGDAILQLADFMRYVVQEGDKTAIPLAKEVEYITHYIELQRLRLSDLTKIDFQTSGNLENATIAPLLFMPFIENAFAYGVSTRLPSRILIHISVENNARNNTENNTENNKTAPKITLKVENPILKTSRSTSNGVALINTKRRLTLLYPEQHELTISENGAEYKVQLVVQ